MEELEICFSKVNKKTEYKHLQPPSPYKNAKIYIFAQKHQLELMHEGIKVFINSNKPFLKSPGTTSPTPSYSWLRGWEYKITITYFGSQKFDWNVTYIIHSFAIKKFPFWGSEVKEYPVASKDWYIFFLEKNDLDSNSYICNLKVINKLLRFHGNVLRHPIMQAVSKNILWTNNCMKTSIKIWKR